MSSVLGFEGDVQQRDGLALERIAQRAQHLTAYRALAAVVYLHRLDDVNWTFKSSVVLSSASLSMGNHDPL